MDLQRINFLLLSGRLGRAMFPIQPSFLLMTQNMKKEERGRHARDFINVRLAHQDSNPTLEQNALSSRRFEPKARYYISP